MLILVVEVGGLSPTIVNIYIYIYFEAIIIKAQKANNQSSNPSWEWGKQQQEERPQAKT